MPLLADFSVLSEPGNERLASKRVTEAVAPLELDERQVERLATAVSEATLNAMEHGNLFMHDRRVVIRVEASDTELQVSVTDQGSGPERLSDVPDLEKKLAGEQTPRGWGLFLIEKMVDDVCDETSESGHTLRLSLHLKPGQLAG